MTNAPKRGLRGSRPFAALRRWLFDPVPAHSMVITRIGLGGVLFFAYLSRWPYVATIYGPAGYGGSAYHDRFPESGAVGWSPVRIFDQLQFVSSEGVIWSLYLLLLVTSLAFALGVRSGISGTATLALHTLFIGRNPGATWGWATMIVPFLAYAILAGTGRHASIVVWFRGRKNPSRACPDWAIAAWPMRLLQVHVACTFFVLWSRIDEGSWLSGQMLPMALMRRDWARLDVDWFPLLSMLEFGGKAALVLELGAPLALWIRPIARYWALALMGMFSTLIVTTSVGWWDFVMLIVLTTFLPHRWLERIVGPRGVEGSQL